MSDELVSVPATLDQAGRVTPTLARMLANTVGEEMSTQAGIVAEGPQARFQPPAHYANHRAETGVRLVCEVPHALAQGLHLLMPQR